MYSVGLYTLGCKVSQYETEALSEAFVAAGFAVRRFDEPCDVYVINTCTVTSESDRKSRQVIRRARKTNPDGIILVMGCYSQRSPDEVMRIEGVRAVVGTENKLSLVGIAKELLEGKREKYSSVTDVNFAEFEPMRITRAERTRAYVKIEDGCECRCTYCAIADARGRVRSKPSADVVAEVEGLSRSGVREIVLTGIETGSYGADLEDGQDLASLLCEIDKLEGIGRVRLGSLDPTVIKPGFVEKIKNLKSLAPHFHLSLQSGSDKVLAAMKRKYNSRQAMQSIERLREAMPSVKFTTDIITGFPGESDEDFECSCDFARRAEFLMVHAFPYSKRKGTPAAEMKDQIPEDVKKQRVHTLTEICRNVRSKMFDRIIEDGEPREVLFESFDGEYATGHTADFIEVRVKSDRPMHAELAYVKILSHNTESCEGILIDK